MFKLDASAVAVRVEGEVVTHSEGNRTVRPEGDVSEQSPTVRPEGDAVTRSKGNGSVKQPLPRAAKVANSDAEWQEF